jgi:AraC-like DNA-binding protein
VDSVLNSSFKYLSGKIHKEYDTKQLLREKEQIQVLLHKRQRREQFWAVAMTLVLLLLGLTLYRYYWNRKRYREKFEALMQKGSRPPMVKKGVSGKPDINPEVAAAILKQLERFEKGRKFLEKDLTLVKLAAAFNSNTKYLSKTIAHYRGKKFVEYLNDLKVDHITQLMKTDRRLRNYTNSALAEEAGFSTTQRFTNAFFSRNGITPPYFAKCLKEQENGDTNTIDPSPFGE